jgi:hypothetical protein
VSCRREDSVSCRIDTESCREKTLCPVRADSVSSISHTPDKVSKDIFVHIIILGRGQRVLSYCAARYAAGGRIPNANRGSPPTRHPETFLR